MGYKKRRIISFLLAFAMIIGLVSGAGTRSSVEASEKRELKACWTDWEGNVPKRREDKNEYFNPIGGGELKRHLDFYICDEDNLNSALELDSTFSIKYYTEYDYNDLTPIGAGQELDPADVTKIIKPTTYWKDTETGSEETEVGDGFFTLNFDNPGLYEVTASGAYPIYVEVVFPQIGIYDSSDTFDADTLVSSGDDFSVPYEGGATYYLHTKEDNAYNITLTATSADGIVFDKITDKAQEQTIKVEIPGGINNDAWINVELATKWNEGDAPEIRGISFRVTSIVNGLAVSYAEWDDKEQEQRFNYNVDNFRKMEEMEINRDWWCSMGMISGDEVTPVDITKVSVTKDGKDAKNLVEMNTTYGTREGDKEAPVGVCQLRFKDTGVYTFKTVVEDKESSFDIDVRMPRVAIYSSSTASIDKLVCNSNEAFVVPGSTYYILFDRSAFDYDRFDAATINYDDSLGIKDTSWTKDGGLVSFTVPEEYSGDLDDAIKINIRYLRVLNHPEEGYDFFDYNYNFREKLEGLVIAGVDWDNIPEGQTGPSFARKEWFRKDSSGEIPGSTHISLGWCDGDEIEEVKDVENISIVNADGTAVTPGTISLNKDDRDGDKTYTLVDGVYRIEANEVRDYKIIYNNGEKTYSVRFNTEFPRVGVYKANETSMDNLICRFGDDLEYSSGEKFYIIASDSFKVDDNVKSVEYKYNDPFVKTDSYAPWDYKNRSMEVEIPADAYGRYESAIELKTSYNDGRVDENRMNLEEKKEGWKIADADWGKEGPTPRTEINDYSSEITAEILDEKFISIGDLYNDGEETKIMFPNNEDVEIRILDYKKDPVTDPSECSISKEYDAMGSMKPTPDGVFRLNTNVVGIYYIEMKYENLVHEFKLNVRMPQLGLYTTSSVFDPNTLVSTRSYEGLIDGTQANELFLAHNWSEGEIFDIQCVDLHLDDGITADKTHFDRKDLANNSLTKVTFPPTNKPLAIEVDVTRGSQEHPRKDEFHISVRPAAVGFVISYSKNNTFNENADSYGKDWGVEVKNDGIVSLAILSEGNLTPITEEGKLSLVTADGAACTDGSTISKETDGGVYAIKINTPGDYKLVYDENQTVDINADFSNVAFVTEEGATYNSIDGSASKICDDPFGAKLKDDQGEQLFEKDFYIGSYAYPADFAGRNKRDISIKTIEVKRGDETIKPEKGFSYEIPDDKHTAKLNVNMDAIDIVKGKLNLKVTYDVNYYYYDGEHWVIGYQEFDRDNWFEIDLGDKDGLDPRKGLTATDLNGMFVGDGYDRDTHSFEYDGTKKTLLYQIDNEEYAKLVDYHYEDNEETAINEDAEKYDTYVSFTIKDEYKAQYKIKGKFRNETFWTIVTPKAVKEIKGTVETDITSKPEDMTAEDEDIAKAVTGAKEKYDKLNDAQKKLISDEDTAKLTKAATAIKNYSDAVDKISNLPDTVALSDEAAIKAARTVYDKLTDAQKEVADDKYDITEKLETAEKELAKKKAEKKAADDKAAADAAVAKISKLPNNAGVDDEAAVKAARDAYDALTEDQKKLVDASILKKLTNAEESVAKAKKAAEDEKNKPKYSNEWIDGKWYNEDGTQTYPGTLQWKSNATGWWVEDTDGWYPTDQWQKIDGVWYYFKPDGYMAANEYYKGYWFNADGSWDDKYLLSWKSNATGWWVEDISGWWPASQWLKIDGYWYYFDASGYMVTSQYVDGWWISADGVCY